MSDKDTAPISIRALDRPVRSGSSYPQELRPVVQGRSKRILGDVFGLDQFGVNLTELLPGAASALRHWHEREDEFIYVLSGRPVLITDAGETQLEPGDCAGFKAGIPNAHHLVNREDEPAVYLEVGTRAAEERCHYPDNAMRGFKEGGRWVFKR